MSMTGDPMFCFVAGTTVLTTLGKKAIETIQIGDTIPCVDHITGEAAEKRVVTTTVNKVNRLIELDVDGEIIQCTETHPLQQGRQPRNDPQRLFPAIQVLMLCAYICKITSEVIMNNKKCRLFLWISLSIFALSVIAVLLYNIVACIQIERDWASYPDVATSNYVFLWVCGTYITLPQLMLELSGIRSVYKILKHRPKGSVRICCLISAILSFSTLVFHGLLFIAIICARMVGESSIDSELILITSWPVLIVALVLGSRSIKQDDKHNDLQSSQQSI